MSPEDAGKEKGPVIVSKLSEMNPFSKISYKECEFGKLKEFLTLEKYSSVVFGLKNSFEEAIQVNNLAREVSLPYYCLNSSGLNAFIFSDLATDKFEFCYAKKDAEGTEQNILSSIEGSLSL